MMMRLLIAVAALGLTGCTTSYDFSAVEAPPARDDVDYYRGRIYQQSDEYAGTRALVGGDIKHAGGGYTPSVRYRLRTGNLAASTDYKIYAEVMLTYSGGWKFFEEAAADGRVLPVTIANRVVGRCRPVCTFSENLLVTLDRETLARFAAADGPYRIKVYAKDGSEDVVLFSANYIAAFLEELPKGRSAGVSL